MRKSRSSNSGMYARKTLAVGPEARRRKAHLADEDMQRLRALVTGFEVSSTRPRMVLDLGSGIGIRTARLAKLFPRARIIGIDLHSDQFKSAGVPTIHSANRVTFMTGDIAYLPFRERSFDVVNIDSTLWVLRERERILAAARRLLKRGGLLMVHNHDASGFSHLASPHAPAAVRRLDEAVEALFDSWGYDQNLGHKLYSLLRRCGFHTIDVEVATQQVTAKNAKHELQKKLQFFSQLEPFLLERRLMTRGDLRRAYTALRSWMLRNDFYACRLLFRVLAKD